MKRSFIILGYAIFALAILGLIEAQFHFLSRWGVRSALDQRELATQFLGQYLATHYAGKTAVVFSNPFSVLPGQPRNVYQFEKAGLRGLRRGLGSAILIKSVAFPELRPEFHRDPSAVFIDPSTTTPLSYLTAPNAWDLLLKQHHGVELVISLIGVPINLRETVVWSRDNRTKIALLLPDLRIIGDRHTIREALISRKIAALILSKPGAPPEDQPLGSDLQMEFEQRFLLVTAETIDSYLSIYPQLF